MNHVLEYVIFNVGIKWQDQSRELKASLTESGIICVDWTDGEGLAEWQEITSLMKKPEHKAGQGLLVLTDSPRQAAALREKGVVCIGCQWENSGFFEGAYLVTDCIASLDVQTLEETYLHARGLPVTIAETRRLVIREITSEDFDFLWELSQKAGMGIAMDRADDNCFSWERLEAYIAHVYRFYGYGLWMVLLKNGIRIGCCGLGDREELQYAVAPGFRRRGYAEEMCRAVMGYVFSRTDRESLWIRVRPENKPSRRLAAKLGFSYRYSSGDMQFYQYDMDKVHKNHT